MKLACMGDSLTNGHGLDPKLCWTNLLAQKLSIDVVNYGISGDTTGGMVGRFNNMLIAEQPTHVFIMGGTNDLSFGLPDNLILSNLKTMTRQARHIGVSYILGVPSTYYPSGEAKLYEINIDQFVDRLSGLQSRIKQFIDVDVCLSVDFSYGMDRAHFLDDGIHPNEAGQVIMADRAVESLRDLVL